MTLAVLGHRSSCGDRRTLKSAFIAAATFCGAQGLQIRVPLRNTRSLSLAVALRPA